ncbi:MAG: 1,4-alpha-glucan branching protein GlgB [Candidatus Cyclobacteriaceae bacterium M3_2C_046]
MAKETKSTTDKTKKTRESAKKEGENTSLKKSTSAKTPKQEQQGEASSSLKEEVKKGPSGRKTSASRKPGVASRSGKASEKASSKSKSASSVRKPSTRKKSEAKSESQPNTPEIESNMNDPVIFVTRFSDYDVHLYREGRHFHLYEKFGSHVMEHNGKKGTYFAVWAPNAKYVSVIGNFNEWNRESHKLMVRFDSSGIWEGFIPDLGQGEIYKYYIESHSGNYWVEKADPYAIHAEIPPQTASVVWERDFQWSDDEWMKQRKQSTGKPKPFSVYEMHLGSWRRVPEDGFRSLSYRELASQLPPYLNDLGYTHVEFMPVMEHPFFGSWGYQVTGYFAPSSRYGSPQDFMYLVNELHKAGIGVILDWVPSHFPSDQHGLSYFDGSHLYEHSDPREGYHPDWNSYIFNYGRHEVRSFLISNAIYWLDKFHIDGLRVDAVASMLYRDYSRKQGEWIPNEFGGRENLEAISLLKQFNEEVHLQFPDTYTIAEESTAWPMVSKPTYIGGLGFDMKWMMGWMHDTLEYFSKDPIHRQYHQNEITFSIIYAFTESYMLPLSHDEVVYGKQSLVYKMPGDDWQKFANLRLLYGYMYAHPGGKLIYMGGEFGQTAEWAHDNSLDWHLLDNDLHKGISTTLKALNNIYKNEKALYETNFEEKGFEWVDINDSANSVICFLRKGENPDDMILVVCSFTPVVHSDYRVGVPRAGKWVEIFNSDDVEFKGSGVRNHERHTEDQPSHGRDHSICLNLPPLGVTYMKFQP